jgi:uncharacterized membrane protein
MTTAVGILLIAILGVASHFSPVSTRPDLFFAVTINPDFRRSAQAARIVRRYRIGIWISTALGILVVALTAGMVHAKSFMLGSLLSVIAVQTFLFLEARSAISAHAVPVTGIREAALTARKPGLPGSTIVLASPFLVLAALALRAYAEYGLPRGRVHIAFDPTWLAPPSAARAYGLLLLIGLICVVLFTVELALIKGMRRVNASGVFSVMELRGQRISEVLLLGIQYLLVFLAWLSITTSMSSATKEEVMVGWRWTVLAMVVAAIGAALWNSKQAARYYKTPEYWLSQIADSKGPITSSGSASDKPTPLPARGGREQTVGDGIPDRCWKLGLFYYNPEDPAIIVEKRFGMGQSLNFGNPWAWVFLAVVAAVTIVILVR